MAVQNCNTADTCAILAVREQMSQGRCELLTVHCANNINNSRNDGRMDLNCVIKMCTSGSTVHKNINTAKAAQTSRLLNVELLELHMYRTCAILPVMEAE